MDYRAAHVGFVTQSRSGTGILVSAEPSFDNGDCLYNCRNGGDCQCKRHYRERDVQPEHPTQVNLAFCACQFNCDTKATHRFDLRMRALLRSGGQPIL